MMLDRMEGNAELKTSVQQMLATRRLTHSVLLVGEAGLGTGFAARCIAADYLYPAGGAAADCRGMRFVICFHLFSFFYRTQRYEYESYRLVLRSSGSSPQADGAFVLIGVMGRDIQKYLNESAK